MEQESHYFDPQLYKIPTSELHSLVADARVESDAELLGLIRNEVAVRIQELKGISRLCSDALSDTRTSVTEDEV